MVAATVLVVLIVAGIFAPFLSPYDPTIAGRNKDYLNGAPNVLMFCDKNGCSFRPFLHTIERERSLKTNFRWVETINEDKRRYIQFFVEGSDRHPFLGFIPGDIHLFGIDDGYIHLFGTDASGKDIFSRTLHAIWTSLQVGTIGVFIAFVLALVIGGISGYYGGWIDSVLQMVTDAVRTVPAIPLFMAIAAFIPQEWTAEMRFFFISLILGLIGWPTLARRVRTHLLTERNQEYVLAAQLAGIVIAYHPAAPAAVLHQLYHRRSGDLLSLYGAVGNGAQFHRARAERPGEFPRCDAAECHQCRCPAELPVVFHPGHFLHHPGDGLRLCR